MIACHPQGSAKYLAVIAVAIAQKETQSRIRGKACKSCWAESAVRSSAGWLHSF